MKLKNGKMKIKQKDLKHETNIYIYIYTYIYIWYIYICIYVYIYIYIYGFQQFETIRSFGDNIYIGKINIDEAEKNQSNLLENLAEFNN